MPRPTNALAGASWQRTTSGNHLTREDGLVIKRYGDRLAAWVRETELLGRLGASGDGLPLPRLVPPGAFGELRYAYVDGVPGDEALAAGLAPQVLAGMGAFLRRLHAVDPEPLADVLPGAGPVVAHGDFAPYNVVVDGATGALRAVLDWEEARRDSPALDLGWCEAQVLGRFPHLRGAIRHLHDAYGAAPDRAAREHALEQRMNELRARAHAVRDGSPAGEAREVYWCTFPDPGEAAAFIAALSRALAGPVGAAYRAPGAEPLVWAADDGSAIVLSAGALRATAGCFGAVDARPIARSEVPVSCRPLFGAGEIPAWGLDAARGRLTRR